MSKWYYDYKKMLHYGWVCSLMAFLYTVIFFTKLSSISVLLHLCIFALVPLISLFLWKSLEHLKAKILQTVKDLERETERIVCEEEEQIVPQLVPPPYEKSLSLNDIRHKVNCMEISYEEKKGMLKLLRDIDDSE